MHRKGADMNTVIQSAIIAAVLWSALNVLSIALRNPHVNDHSRVAAESPLFKVYIPSACRNCVPAGRFVATSTPPVPHTPACSVYSGCIRTAKADYDSDGVVDSILVASFNSQGQPLRTESDTDRDGAVDRVEVNDYLVDGRLARSLWSVNTDADYEYEIEYRYSDSGALLHRKRWSLPGRTLSFVEEWVYRADGTMELATVDGDVDGRADIERRYQYDSNGSRIRENVFRRGQLDLVYRFSISRSVLVNTLVDPGPGNTIHPKSRIDYTYNSSGSLIRVEATRRDNSVVLWGDEYSYNTNGMMESVISYYTRGIPEAMTWQFYDDDGRVAKMLEGEQSEPDVTTEFTYVCTR